MKSTEIAKRWQKTRLCVSYFFLQHCKLPLTVYRGSGQHLVTFYLFNSNSSRVV